MKVSLFWLYLLAAAGHQLHLHDKQSQGKSYIMCGSQSSTWIRLQKVSEIRLLF